MVIKKSKITLLAAGVLVVTRLLFPMEAVAAESSIDISALLGEASDKISTALQEMDESEVKEIFGFVEEKLKDGSLESDDGLEDALKEGENKFGVKIEKKDAKKIVDTMEKLEDMGFSGEYVVEKAEKLYDQYGADFVDHTDEVVKGAIGNAVQNTTKSFFKGLLANAKAFVKSVVDKI